MTTDVSKDVIKFHGEDDQQENRAVVPIVCHVAKVAERASEKSEPEHTQADALNVALGLIRDHPPIAISATVSGNKATKSRYQLSRIENVSKRMPITTMKLMVRSRNKPVMRAYSR